MSDIPFPPEKITVRYVPHKEAPGRPVRIDYGSIAHEYVTRLDAIEINRDSTLGIRCKEATGLEPDWVEQGVSEAYSQLAAILTTLDAPVPSFPGYDPGMSPQGRFPCVHVAVGPEAVEEVLASAPEPAVTEADFDLFPAKDERRAADLMGPGGDFEVRKDADGGFTVLGGCKVSDDDGGRPCPPEHETTIDFAMDLRAPGSDPVHAPSHYTDGGIETIDYLRAKLSREAFIGFCQGNALKYLSRAGKKGSAAEDFAKAAVYCRWAEEASR